MSETEHQRHDVLHEVLRFGTGFKNGKPASLVAVTTDWNLGCTLAEAKRSDPTDRAPEVDAGTQT